jgi:FMN phosphatase YigB (HAD superfamily)
MSKVFVDFDKTLTTGSGERWWVNPLDEEPRSTMIELVNNLYKQGNTIIVYTARREEVREETQYYLNQWGVMHHALKMEKPGYDLLIDDRAVSDATALDFGADKLGEIAYE